ncbi:MAG: hypothetical protein ABEJ65_03155 [bacterium]
MEIWIEDAPASPDGKLLFLMPEHDTSDTDMKLLFELDRRGKIDTTTAPPEDNSSLPFPDYIHVVFPHGPYQPPRFTGNDEYDDSQLPTDQEWLEFLRNIARECGHEITPEIKNDPETLIDTINLECLR